jgi:hypothetical protein
MALTNNVVSEFRNKFNRAIITPSDQHYDDARRVWNGAVNSRPSLIVRPQDTNAVAMAIRFAFKNRMPVAVLGGGYDWAGRSVRSGAIVIDLARFAHVEIDSEQRVAHAGGGARCNEVLLQASRSGLTAVAGAVGTLGMAGFTMSGGYGPLTPSLGLGVDNLLSAEIVLADGTLIRASEEESPELLWALRGGGGNFGIVTSLDLRLHRVTEVLAGRAIYPWNTAVELLGEYGQQMASAPDNLAVTLALVSSPDGKPAVALAPCWQGDLVQGREQVEKLIGLAKPDFTRIGPMKPLELFSLFEANAMPGRRYAQQTRWLSKIGHDVAQLLIAAAEAKTSPLCAIAIQSFHGVPSRVPTDATAFPTRQPHFLVSIVAAWGEGNFDEDERNRAWATVTTKALEPYSLPGGYASLLGPHETAQLECAYGSNKTRLIEIKRQFDPSNLFSANGPIAI